MSTNKISIPHIPQLDAVDSSAKIIDILETYGTRRAIECVNWKDKFPYHPLTTFTVAHSGTALYIDFFVRCNYLRAENYVNLSPVSSDSCVEFFVQPREDDPEYWNFEFNCIGTVNASHRTRRDQPTRLNDDQIATVRRYPSCGTRPFKELEGLFTWDLLVVIPFSLIGIEYNHDDGPIKMRGNFYKCASATSLPHYLSWNPIDTPAPDFHRPEFFGDIILE